MPYGGGRNNIYLVLREEIENWFYQILNFEKGTRNEKGYLVVEREFSLLNLTRFFEIEKSRHAMLSKCAYEPDLVREREKGGNF